jgi:hypothetical protein
MFYIRRVGPNRVYTPYMTVYLVISLPKISYIYRIHTVLANLIYTVCIQYFWQGNHHIYGVYIRFWPTLYIRFVYSIFGREITIYTVYIYGSGQPCIYGLYTVFLAGKSPYIRCINIYGSGQP